MNWLNVVFVAVPMVMITVAAVWICVLGCQMNKLRKRMEEEMRR